MNETRNYLLLTSMTKQAAAAGKKLIANVTAIDHQAKLLWFDSAHVGIVLTTELPATDIWGKALAGVDDLNDILIIEIGRDWMARSESKYDHWFKTHVGIPRMSLNRR